MRIKLAKCTALTTATTALFALGVLTFADFETLFDIFFITILSDYILVTLSECIFFP